MTSICLKTEVKLVSNGLKANASLVCGWNSNYFPVLLDEGFLFVDYKDEVVKLYVKRYERKK